MNDYRYAKYGNFIFSRFGFIVQTDRITHEITDVDDRYTHVNTVGMSNELINIADYHQYHTVCNVIL